MPPKSHRSVSTEQAEAEQELIAALSAEVGLPLAKEKLDIDGSRVEIDGVGRDARRIVLAEGFARLSKLKAGQKRKILTDAFKLAFVAEHLRQANGGTAIEAYLVFASENAAAAVTGEAWATKAISTFGLKVRVYPLSLATHAKVEAAEKRQGADFR